MKQVEMNKYIIYGGLYKYKSFHIKRKNTSWEIEDMIFKTLKKAFEYCDKNEKCIEWKDVKNVNV